MSAGTGEEPVSRLRCWLGWTLFVLLAPLVLGVLLLAWVVVVGTAVGFGVVDWWLEGAEELRGLLAQLREGRKAGPVQK